MFSLTMNKAYKDKKNLFLPQILVNALYQDFFLNSIGEMSVIETLQNI